MARLDRLAPAKEVAQIGAAIGREFSYRLLAAVASMSEDRLSTALHELAGAELIFAHGEPPEATYTFKHALVQDAAYSTLLKSRRRQLHARIAAALESDFPDQAEARPELVAHHATEAGHVRESDRLLAQGWRPELGAGGDEGGRRALSVRRSGWSRSCRRAFRGTREELGLLLALGPAQQAIKGSVSSRMRPNIRPRSGAGRAGGRGEGPCRNSQGPDVLPSRSNRA